mmetsp:Transcript_22374/g.28705  ORF Transcript_22374/g.28705 Transcript_22374/m.28705 type:complete len:86 (+) Transcript_22374:885-1142(+)
MVLHCQQMKTDWKMVKVVENLTWEQVMSLGCLFHFEMNSFVAALMQMTVNRGFYYGSSHHNSRSCTACSSTPCCLLADCCHKYCI